MSNPVLTAAILIEANGAALNNAGGGTGQRLDNAVIVKQVRIGRNSYPYISGQAVRRWWREVLYSDFGWQPSPVTREAKSAYTEGDPIQYPDDDVFGYMAAKKVKRASKKKTTPTTEVVAAPDDMEAGMDDTATADSGTEEGEGTQRRVSPLKNSLLVSVLPRVITADFGTFTRNLPVGADPVPYEHEHYTALMQGVFTLSLQDVGRFECGLMRDLPLNTPVPNEVRVSQNAEGNLKPRVLSLSLAKRRERVAQTVKALGRLRHGANLARNLSDVMPVVVLMGYLDGGNAPFQNLFAADGNEQVMLHLPRLESVIKDYQDRILGDKCLYFGFRPGVLANEAEVVTKLTAGIEGVKFAIGTPGETIKKVAELAEHGSFIEE